MLLEVCSGVCFHETLSDHLTLNCHCKVQTYSYKNLKRSDKPFCFYLPLTAEETKFRKYFLCNLSVIQTCRISKPNSVLVLLISPLTNLIQLGIFYQAFCRKTPHKTPHKTPMLKSPGTKHI